MSHYMRLRQTRYVAELKCQTITRIINNVSDSNEAQGTVGYILLLLLKYF
jgi:hypothetical protein